MLRAILFDYDGTIVLSEPLHFSAFVDVLERRGITLSEHVYYERYLGWTDEECARRMVDDFGLATHPGSARDLLREKVEAMAARIAAGVPLAPGAEAFVAESAARYPLALVSAGLRREIVPVLRGAGLEPFFPVLVAAEDVAVGKPDPEGFRLACRRLRDAGLVDLRASECLVLEDSPAGIAAAHGAGMRVVALAHTRPAAELTDADLVLPGYGSASWPELERLADR